MILSLKHQEIDRSIHFIYGETKHECGLFCAMRSSLFLTFFYLGKSLRSNIDSNVDLATIHMYGLKMRRKQLDLFLQNKKNPDPFFGGSDLKSHPKKARPISTKDYMHVVLKSDLAKGPLSFLRIERIIISSKFGR